jgi:formylglycine-generating enzyme required for sulfatase activity
MKTTLLIATLASGLFTGLLPAQITNPVAIFPDEDSNSPATHRLVWESTPGVRYEVQQSGNLTNWATAPGFPAPAPGPAQAMPFTATNSAQFFRVAELDEQPPAIMDQYPPDGGFAVPRFSKITFQLGDVTGIDTNSIRLTVGTNGTFTLASPKLTYTNGVLTYDGGGDVSLGAYGQTNQSSLIVADTLGNRGTNSFSFKLEVEPQVVGNLFVFGSSQAQRAGQRVGSIPTAVLATRFGGGGGPIRAGDGDPWTLQLVESNRVVLAYTNTAPVFALDQYVCNLTPASPSEIFNRKITHITDDPGNKLLTLYTIEVPMEEMVTNGTAAVTGDSYILEMGTNGMFARAFAIGGSVTFPQLGISFDGMELHWKEQTTGLDIVRFTAEELHWWITPRISAELEISGKKLKRFEAVASGTATAAAIGEIDFLLAGIAYETTLLDLPSTSDPKMWVAIGAIGPIPVFASLGLNSKLTGRAEAVATVNLRAGYRQNAEAEFGIRYAAPDVTWVRKIHFSDPQIVAPSAGINVEGSVELALEPRVEFLVYGLAGIGTWLTPRVSLTVEEGTSQQLHGELELAVTLDMTAAGPAFDLARQTFHTAWELSVPLWSLTLWSFPDPSGLAWTLEPQSQTVALGQSVTLSSQATAPTAPTYLWTFNGTEMPGKTARTLTIPSVSYGDQGNYRVRASAGGQPIDSRIASLTVVPPGTPSGMALIPAGSFLMGDTFTEGSSDERPTHTVYVSAFYMDRTEVTKALWDEVKGWNGGNGYSYDNAGAGKAANHPVQTISWYDCVKWCNARSQKEGLTPCYYTDAGLSVIYKTGQVAPSVNWAATGYRLPTEAEWEKAARGGWSGRRYPWGDTISGADANYNTSSTMTVGSYPPNSYGILDVAGNVWELCWDWWDDDWYQQALARASDTPGPPSPMDDRRFRVMRGASFSGDANYARCACRGTRAMNHAGSDVGFRCVRRAY